jgi:Holliday junction resolvasome RuvABC endonuclease subunit
VGAKRILAIDPTSKGFGFVVLEGPVVLIDWGVKHASGDRNHRCLKLVVELIGRYQPDVFVVEDTRAKGSRRCLRVRRLIDDLLALVQEHQLRARRISRQTVRRYFARSGLATKRQVAVALTQRFPELEPYLPPVRKAWMTEDERMSVFDAVAFTLALFEPARQVRATALSPPTSLTHVQ